jgi:hypothetical protein
MSTQTLVRVTAEHIARGVVKDCEKCPVALAVIDALGDLFTKDSTVDAECDSIIFWPGPDLEMWRAPTPTVAADFIDAFDSYFQGTAAPFEFVLKWRGPRNLEPLP